MRLSANQIIDIIQNSINDGGDTIYLESPEDKQYTLVDSCGDTFTVSYEVVNDMRELFTKHPSGISITDYSYIYNKGDLVITPYHLGCWMPVILIETNFDVDSHDTIELMWRGNEAFLKHLHDLIEQ